MGLSSITFPRLLLNSPSLPQAPAPAITPERKEIDRSIVPGKIVIRLGVAKMAAGFNEWLPMNKEEALYVARVLNTPEAKADPGKTVREYYFRGRYYHACKARKVTQDFAQLFSQLRKTDEGKSKMKEIYSTYKDYLAYDDRLKANKEMSEAGFFVSPSSEDKTIATAQMAAQLAIHANKGYEMTPEEAVEIGRILETDNATGKEEKTNDEQAPMRVVTEYYHQGLKFSQLFKQLSKSENGRTLLAFIYPTYRNYLTEEDRLSIQKYDPKLHERYNPKPKYDWVELTS